MYIKKIKDMKVYDFYFSSELLNIANTITKLELWTWMKKPYTN